MSKDYTLGVPIRDVYGDEMVLQVYEGRVWMDAWQGSDYLTSFAYTPDQTRALIEHLTKALTMVEGKS